MSDYCMFLPPKYRSICWWIAIFAFILIRMYVVGQDGILPIDADSENYALQANYYLANSAFRRLPAQLPGLSMLAMATSEFGVPFKLFLDGLLIVTGLLTFLVIRRVAKSSLAGMCAFCLIAFHPWFIYQSKFFMPESVTAVLLMLLFLGAGHFVFVPVHRWRIGTTVLVALASACYVVTRPEFALLTCYWIMVGLIVALAQRTFPNRSGTIRQRRHLRWLLIVVPLLSAFLATKALERIHLVHYGIAASSCTEMPGFKALANALYSIPPEREIRFAPVTRQSIATACDFSPTLAEYRAMLLDTEVPSYANAREALNLEGEFGTWLNWHLIAAIGSNPEANRKMQRAADEIRSAQAVGRLGKRIAVYPVDPLWRQWLPDVFSASTERLVASLYPHTFDLARDPLFVKNRGIDDPVRLGFFETSLLRLGAPGDPVTWRIQASSAETEYRRARLVARSGRTLDTGRVSRTWDGKYEVGFVWRDRHDTDVEPLALVFRDANQNRDAARVEIDREMENADFQTESVETGRAERWRVSMSRQQYSPTRRRIQEALASCFIGTPWLLAAMVMAAGFFADRIHKRAKRILAFAAIGILFVVGRSLFYALIEVWLNWGDFRYVEPNSLLTGTSLLLIAFWLGTILKAASQLRTSSTSHSQAAIH